MVVNKSTYEHKSSVSLPTDSITEKQNTGCVCVCVFSQIQRKDKLKFPCAWVSFKTKRGEHPGHFLLVIGSNHMVMSKQTERYVILEYPHTY